jgi:metal-dependent amidase/aminoacylase/carboxypeptidase family protein
MVDSKKLISLVEKYEKLIYDTADHIWAHPETGFREWKTSAYMEQHFEELGYTKPATSLDSTQISTPESRVRRSRSSASWTP